MPQYTIKCNECAQSGDIRLSFEKYDSVKDGSMRLLCNTCDGKCEIVFDPSSVQFVLKDGISGGWASKAMKENAYRKVRREVLGRKERDHVFKPRLQPNFGGVETGTWKEAQEFARAEISKDLDTKAANTIASSYEPLVTKEKAK